MNTLLKPARPKWTLWFLAASLCANLGFVGAVLVSHARASSLSSSAGRPAASPAESDDFETGASTAELVKRLSLSEEQRGRMAVMKRELMSSTTLLHQQAMQERRRLMTLLRAPEIDRDATRQSLAQIQSIQAKTQQAVVSHIVEERKLLRPEQVEPFNQIVLPRVFGGVLGAGQASFGPRTGSRFSHSPSLPGPTGTTASSQSGTGLSTNP